MPFFADIKRFSNGSECQHFRLFLQNVVNAKFIQRDGHGISKISEYGKVMENVFVKSVGTL